MRPYRITPHWTNFHIKTSLTNYSTAVHTNSVVAVDTIAGNGIARLAALFFAMCGFAEGINRLPSAQISGGQMNSQKNDYVNSSVGNWCPKGLRKCGPLQYSHKKTPPQPSGKTPVNSDTDKRNKKNTKNASNVTFAPPPIGSPCGTKAHMKKPNNDRIELRRDIRGAIHSLQKSINLGKVEIARAMTNRRHIEPQSINALLALAVADLDEPEAWPDAGNAPDGRDRDAQRWARSIVAGRLRGLLGQLEREDELRSIAAATPIIGPAKVGDRGRRGKRHGKTIDSISNRQRHLRVAESV